MEITRNTTGMRAGVFVAVDKDAREHCVVVAKGTFRTDAAGALTLAEAQQPLAAIDQHSGDPATTSVRYACDFVLEKVQTDVVVSGMAVAPGEPVRQLVVRLEVQHGSAQRPRQWSKELLVTGDRRWVRVWRDLSPSPPVPFATMPLTCERAFGGRDDSRGPGRVAAETRNLMGVGFHPHRALTEIEGTALPNIEDPARPVRGPRDRCTPVGFGVLAPGADARRRYAGTYDQHWVDHVAPFLPGDFDPRFFQAAPEDQRFPLFTGGELIRCFNMAATPVVQYRLPALAVPVSFHFVDRTEERAGVLDTVTVEPHRGVVALVWRCKVALGKKPNTLQEIHVGPQPRANAADEPVGFRHGKPAFRGLAAAIRWKRRRESTRP
jgi:hypothetical protein